METPTFGDCLTELIDRHGWSADDLSKAMAVDRSLIYRWRRNERAPKLDSPYVEQIIQLLKLSPVEAALLDASRLRTLREFGEIRQRTSGERGREAVEHFLGSSAQGTTYPTPPPQPRLDLTKVGVIQGSGKAANAAIQLLESLPEAPEQGNEIFSVMLQERLMQSAEAHEFMVRWQKALHGAMRRGWRIHALWRLDRDPQQTIQLVERLLNLLGTGRYFPHYFRRYGQLRPPYDAFVVPGMVAYVSFCTGSLAAPDSALIIRDSDQVEALHQHLRLLASTTEPLVRAYPHLDTVERWASLVRWEEVMQGRLMMRGDLSFHTEPESWARVESAWAESRRGTPEDKRQMVELRQRRMALFHQQVTQYDYWDICPMQAVQHRLAQGVPLRDTEPLTTFWLPPAGRVEHIQHVIWLLRSYEHYQLALVDELEARRLGLSTETQWMATGAGQAVITVRVPNADGKARDLELLVTEPSFASAFRQYYLEQLERIHLDHRNRAHVIAWLEYQLKSVADQT